MLTGWGRTHLRDFPWRHTRDPYRLLIAELMLRRTRASQVVPVYTTFIERFPDVLSLATAEGDDVVSVVEPLGLRWRAPVFQLVARELVARHRGGVPRKREELLELPGVGAYVADAISCFAYEKSVAVVDTNTVRVASRFYGFRANPDSRRRKDVIAAVQGLLDRTDPRLSNFALLDLAATVCTPRNPDCPECPLVSACATGSRAGSVRAAGVG